MFQPHSPTFACENRHEPGIAIRPRRGDPYLSMRSDASGRNAPEKTLDLLWENAKTVSMRRGYAVFHARTQVTDVYRVLSGRIDVFVENASGKAAPLYHVGAGMYLFEAAFSKLHDTSALCTTPCVLQQLPVTRFHALLRQDSPLALALCRHLATDIADLRHTCQHLGPNAGPLRERILAYVASNADPMSGTLELPYSLRAWAQELGVAHETLSRTLRQVQREGLLGRPATRIFINKVKATG